MYLCHAATTEPFRPKYLPIPKKSVVPTVEDRISSIRSLCSVVFLRKKNTYFESSWSELHNLVNMKKEFQLSLKPWMKSLQTVNVELEFKLAQNGLRPRIFRFESLRQRLEEVERNLPKLSKLWWKSYFNLF